MIFKCPKFPDMKRLQGVFISPEELPGLVMFIKSAWKNSYYVDGMKYKIDIEKLQQINAGLTDASGCDSSARQDKSTHDRLFSKVVLWTLGQNEISCNVLMRTFNLGWNRASRLIESLYDLGIVGDLDAKLPRKVLSQFVDDVSEDVLELLINNGVSEEAILDAIRSRN